MLKKEWKEQGFIDEPVAEGTDLKAEIRRLCEEKGAIILAHYYTIGDIQDIADFVGDSLALARKAAETDAKMMVMCGVHFMAETCKLLSPDKTVLCPDLNAGCSLADSCKAEDLKKYKDEHPGYQVISYVNTTAAVKALTDVVVTSGNAKKVVDQLPKDAKLIFGPDYNLGNYINEVTGRKMLLWNGGCHVHERFSVLKIAELKKQYPEAVVNLQERIHLHILALVTAAFQAALADFRRHRDKYLIRTRTLHLVQNTGLCGHDILCRTILSCVLQHICRTSFYISQRQNRTLTLQMGHHNSIRILLLEFCNL